ncbi:MAG: nucleoside deaminase [Desulfurobacteriaceae bacterium]
MAMDILFLLEAVKEAKKAFNLGEVPIGAVVVKDNKVVARGFNQKEFLQDPTAHAEIIAIKKASLKLGSWRLNDCTLYSTVEPCVMCCGAIIQSRIKKVVYAIPDPKFGGIESLFKIFENEKINHRPIVEKIYIKEAEDLLKEFFKILRKK